MKPTPLNLPPLPFEDERPVYMSHLFMEVSGKGLMRVAGHELFFRAKTPVAARASALVLHDLVRLARETGQRFVVITRRVQPWMGVGGELGKSPSKA